MAGMSAPLRDVLITEELVHRSVREPNYKAENSTLQELAEALAQEPQDLLERLPQMAVDLCHADSAVLSILENAGGEETFRWATAAGKLREYRGRVCRRLSSFSASCLERGTPQLYSFPTRSYSDAADLPLTLTEVLVVPLHMQSDGAGTLWIAHHDASRQFDATDMRIMLTLVAFGAGAVSVLKSMTERRHAESEQRESEDHFRSLSGVLPPINPSTISTSAGRILRAAPRNRKSEAGLPPTPCIRTIVSVVGMLMAQASLSADGFRSNIASCAMMAPIAGCWIRARPGLTAPGSSWAMSAPASISPNRSSTKIRSAKARSLKVSAYSLAGLPTILITC
jgi:hypothetical protein